MACGTIQVLGLTFTFYWRTFRAYMRLCRVCRLQMLIYFFSDRNYVRSGFYARYSISACPHNCSDHGHCPSSGRECLCAPGYAGRACQHLRCPDTCARNGGQCTEDRSTCVCPSLRRGFDCGLTLDLDDTTTAMTSDFRWSQLIAPTDSSFEPRAGHASATIDDCLYVFGGTTLNQLLDNLLFFCVESSVEWTPVNRTSPWPSARQGHAMDQFDSRWIYLYGGLVDGDTVSGELWLFDVFRSRWKLVPASAEGVMPPAVVGHTLTAVDGEWLYLFGGRTPDGEFMSEVYAANVGNVTANEVANINAGMNIDEDATNMHEVAWQRVRSRGGHTADRRLTGHSTVYHRESRSLLVFGGFSPENARFPRRSALLLSYHVASGHWVRLSYDSDLPAVPRERAYHVAVIVGHYMVIHGGQVHVHHEDETCYDAQIYVYHLSCHVWVDFVSLVSASSGLLFFFPVFIVYL